MNNLFSVKDQVVVITGGTGVLGKAIAAHLAAEGAKVVILGRKAEVGNAIVENIKAKGGEAMFLVTNVLDEAVLKQNLEDILAKYGRVDALLNAAGGNMPGATIAPTGTFFDLKVDEFQKVLNLNLYSTAHSGIFETDGGTEKRCYRKLLIYGCLSSDDSCVRLCGCQGGYFQFYCIHGA